MESKYSMTHPRRKRVLDYLNSSESQNQQLLKKLRLVETEVAETT